jgi:hypothetical protein
VRESGWESELATNLTVILTSTSTHFFGFSFSCISPFELTTHCWLGELLQSQIMTGVPLSVFPPAKSTHFSASSLNKMVPFVVVLGPSHC